MRLLHSDPDGSAAEYEAKPPCDLLRDRRALGEDGLKFFRCDAEVRRDRVLRHPELRQDILAEDGAGMGWAEGGVALGWIAHGCPFIRSLSLSMLPSMPAR